LELYKFILTKIYWRYRLKTLQENHLLEWAKNERKTLKTDAYASVLRPLGIPREKAGSKQKIAWATMLDAHCVGLAHARWTQNTKIERTQNGAHATAYAWAKRTHKINMVFASARPTQMRTDFASARPKQKPTHKKKGSVSHWPTHIGKKKKVKLFFCKSDYL